MASSTQINIHDCLEYTDGEAGPVVQKICIHETVNGFKQIQKLTPYDQVIEADGSERDGGDKQFGPYPKDRSEVGFEVHGNGSGSFGDFWADGTIIGATDAALCENVFDRSTCLHPDPRGSLMLSRAIFPNQTMGLIRLFSKNYSNGHIEENFRIGVNADHFPGFGINPTGDQLNIVFRKGSDYLKVYLGGDNEHYGTFIKDSGFDLKYQSWLGTTWNLTPH